MVRDARRRRSSTRAELHGETAFCYLRDAGAGRSRTCAAFAKLRFLHRRGNLEDLFLKLTGREMRDDCRALPRRAVSAISWRWIAVWRRNYLVWKKLAAECVLGNIIEPLFYLVGFGMGFGAMVPEVEGVKYIAFLAGGTICYSTMLAASFEALYSGFARMHVQRTWEGILNAPVSLEDVVFAEWVWAASKSFLSGTAVLVVAVALGLAQSWTMVLILPLAFLIGLTFAGMGLIMTAMAKSLRLLHVLVHAGADADDAALRRVLPARQHARLAAGDRQRAAAHARDRARPPAAARPLARGRRCCTSRCCWPTASPGSTSRSCCSAAAR